MLQSLWSVFSALLLATCLWWVAAAIETNERTYLSFHKVGDGGCPYTASFLVDAKLYIKIKWGLKWQKMEAANWNAMSACRKRFQFRSPKDYYVNHMSAYEHGTRKNQGYNVSETKTLQFSTAAKVGECGGVGTDFNPNTLAILPFYGGRPPGVQADSAGTLKVTSIGQGNSLVKAEIKSMQTMAVICSLLKYFTYVIIGVARTEDETLIKSEVAQLGESISSRVHVQMLYDLFKPANLPFHLLEYAKEYIKNTNQCLERLRVDTLDTEPNVCNKFFTTFVNKQKSLIGKIVHNSTGTASMVNGWKIQFIYYTESDQIVKFRDIHVRDAILGATNITTMFIGRRLEKNWKSDPTAYMKKLIPTRNVCGNGLYTLDWPNSHYVYKVNATEYESQSNKKLVAPVPGIDLPEPEFPRNKQYGNLEH